MCMQRGFLAKISAKRGRTAGILGEQSRLVGEIFKRLSVRRRGPRWLLLENVPFMLQLHQGKAMRYLVDELERLGFVWAYRVVDTRAFGIPQRRKRVLLLASRTEDPRQPLFGSDSGGNLPRILRGAALRILLDRGPTWTWLGCRCDSDFEGWVCVRHCIAPRHMGSSGRFADDTTHR